MLPTPTRSRSVALTALAGLLLAACATTAPAETPSSTSTSTTSTSTSTTGTPTTGSASTTTPAPTTTPAVPDDAAAQQRVDDAARMATEADTTGGVGVAVLDVAEGASAGTRADEQFYTASLVKIIVAVDVLAQQAAGAAVGQAERDLLRAALGPSNDQAMNQLWTQLDGIGAVARVSEAAGLAGTTAPDDVGQWGSTLMTPADVATLYRYVLTELPTADRDFITAALSAAPPVATDGFNQDFGLLATGARAPKQGWSCCLDDEVQLNSAGLLPAVGDEGTVVVLLSSQPRAPGYDGARAVLDAMATAATRSLTG